MQARNGRWAAVAVVALMNTMGAAAAQTTLPASAPIENVRYEVAFNATRAAERNVGVVMTFDVRTPEPVVLSLPTWTPGAYEESHFAQKVMDFRASTAAGTALDWDKVAPSIWRVSPGNARTVRVEFEFRADTLDNAMAWAQPDFVMLNGTNIFFYPLGQSLDFPATVTFRKPADWLVATGMHAGSAPGTYRESNYHDLVDMPMFIGRMDYDSVQVDGRWTRTASYPAGALSGTARRDFHAQVSMMIPPQAAVFGETPWQHYTNLLIFTDAYAGGSALEHQNSHVGIYNPQFIGNPVLPLITGHEIFHAWNVKRLRPVDMWPYRYDEEQPTTWLWVSEGITDYYADLTLVRSGMYPAELMYQITTGKIDHVNSVPPVALEDASLSIWIHPIDGTDALYYDKGSLAGLLLDIMIRDATDNASSMDDVLRELYAQTYRQGRGFTADEWWAAVTRAAGGRDFAEFNERYVDGREPYPYDAILPLAGLLLRTDSARVPVIGISSAQEIENGPVLVTDVAAGSAAESAGVRVGDELRGVGSLAIDDPGFGDAFRAQYAGAADGTTVPLRIVRAGAEMTLQIPLRFQTTTAIQVVEDPAASEKARRIRDGILTGR